MFQFLQWGRKTIFGERANEELQFPQKLRPKYTQITNGLIRTEEIVAQLFQSEILTEKERDDIQRLLSTSIRANEQMLNILMLKDNHAYDCFIATLKSTDQKHIIEILLCEDKNLDLEHSHSIRRNYATLLENLDVDCGHLLGRLYEAHRITEREMGTINAKPTKHEKNEVLLALVSKFSRTHYDGFLQALKESSQEHIVLILTGKDYVKTSTADELTTTYTDSGFQETFQKIPKFTGDSKCDLRDNKNRDIRHCARKVGTTSHLLRRQLIKTLVCNKFARLPDVLQTELSTKVVVLRQNTVPAPGASVEMCFRKLAEGFIQEKRKVYGQLETLIPDKGSREKRLNLEQELMFGLKEKERLRKQIQERKRQLDQLRYKSDPVSVRTIITKAAAERKKRIRGLTILDKELFTVSEESSDVEVYDSLTFSFCRQWTLKELIYPMDITSCNRNKYLYIFDRKDFGQPMEILRVEPNGSLMKKWSTGEDAGRLSVTHESNVILTVLTSDKLSEYSPNGQLIREINLSGAGIRHPWHAIKLANGHFVVSHGHTVCIVDPDGKLMRSSFGEKCGSAFSQAKYPIYLCVDGNGLIMVTDQDHVKVVLLNSELEFQREIISKEKHGLNRPSRILLDESSGRLFVADSDLNSQRILIFDV